MVFNSREPPIANFFAKPWLFQVPFRSYHDGKNERATIKREIRSRQENYLSSESKEMLEAHFKTKKRDKWEKNLIGKDSFGNSSMSFRMKLAHANLLKISLAVFRNPTISVRQFNSNNSVNYDNSIIPTSLDHFIKLNGYANHYLINCTLP